ncbi:MAG: SPOR domain-containing protein [Christensenellaceae bacterium]|nr:SPOR domain-containing protein [Christensenellaceae bacterium]
MEFSRRRKRGAGQRGRTSSSTGRGRQSAAAGQGGGAGRAVVALLMVGAIVYLVSASAVGTWLAEHVMAPAFDALAAYTGKQPGSEASPPEEARQVSLSTDKSSVSANISLPAIACYTLQMGVYSSADNAGKQAKDLQAQGAGGYILEDGGRYRVLAAGYADEASAKDVKSRLVSEGIDCTVYQLSAPGATFRVSAEQEQLRDVERGFGALYAAQSALMQAALAFDRDAQTVAQGQQAAADILAQLRGDIEVLAPYTDASAAITSIAQCGDTFIDALTKLTGSAAADTAAFAAELKHTQLSLTHAYAQTVAGLVG